MVGIHPYNAVMKAVMKTPCLRRSRLARGFTMMELMVVIAIIAVLFTMTLGGVSWYKRKAAVGRTEVFIKEIGRALQDYRMITTHSQRVTVVTLAPRNYGMVCMATALMVDQERFTPPSWIPISPRINSM